jgi:hypothetical protein
MPDMREFDHNWEVDYICPRIKLIRKAVKDGDYAAALDYLSTIQEKAKAAKYQIDKLQAAK